jgi:ABC-type transport system substrate-binding protein
MRSIRKRTEPGLEARAALAALALLALLGCEGRVAPPIGKYRDVEPQRGGVMRTACFVDVRSLDAATAFDTISSAIEALIYDRLLSYDDAGKLTPQLAESIDVSPDGKRHVFTLRRGVRFHDGDELKASDVKRSIERSLHVNTPCPVPSYYERIVGYKEYHDGKANELSGVKLEGDYVLAIELSEPDATFLHVMALPIVAPLCKSAGSTYDRDFSKHPCGTGPFRVVEYENGQRIRLVRHDGYWQKGKPYLDGIEWSLSVQAFTQRFKFERGEQDYFRELSEPDSVLYRSSPAWQGMGEWEPSLQIGGFFMNTEMPPFDNRHFRRAISFAIDREGIAAVRPGHVQAHGKMVPPVLIPATPGYPTQTSDMGRALEELKLAGYEYDPKTGRGGYPEEIPYLAVIDSFSQQSAEIAQQQLAKIGIRIRIQIVGYPTYQARVSRRRTVPFSFAGWRADYPDPSTFLEPLLSSAAIQEEESQNWAFFSNRALDEILVRARRSTNTAERADLYRRAEQIAVDEAPWAVSYLYRFFELWHPYVHGYRPHPVMSQHVGGMWFDHKERKQALAQAVSCPVLRGPFARCGPDKNRGRTTLALALGGAR